MDSDDVQRGPRAHVARAGGSVRPRMLPSPLPSEAGAPRAVPRAGPVYPGPGGPSPEGARIRSPLSPGQGVDARLRRRTAPLGGSRVVGEVLAARRGGGGGSGATGNWRKAHNLPRRRRARRRGPGTPAGPPVPGPRRSAGRQQHLEGPRPAGVPRRRFCFSPSIERAFQGSRVLSLDTGGAPAARPNDTPRPRSASQDSALASVGLRRTCLPRADSPWPRA